MAGIGLTKQDATFSQLCGSDSLVTAWKKFSALYSNFRIQREPNPALLSPAGGGYSGHWTHQTGRDILSAMLKRSFVSECRSHQFSPEDRGRGMAGMGLTNQDARVC